MGCSLVDQVLCSFSLLFCFTESWLWSEFERKMSPMIRIETVRFTLYVREPTQPGANDVSKTCKILSLLTLPLITDQERGGKKLSGIRKLIRFTEIRFTESHVLWLAFGNIWAPPPTSDQHNDRCEWAGINTIRTKLTVSKIEAEKEVRNSRERFRVRITAVSLSPN